MSNGGNGRLALQPAAPLPLLSEEASHLECSLLELSISLYTSFLSIELHFQNG